MRILFLTHYFYPEGNAPASRALANCKRWVRAGHEVQVITCAPNVPNGIVYDGYKNRIVHRETIEGIEVTRVWTYVAANQGMGKRIANYLSYMASSTLAGLLAKRPDVVIATSPQFFNGWAGVLLGKLRRLPLVLEIRDLWPDSIVAVGAMKNERLLRMLYRLEKRMYASATHVVTVGDGYQTDLVAKGVPKPRISIVPNGVDGELFFPIEPNRDVRRRYHLDGCFSCAYVGTIGMACGLDVVLKAAQTLRDRGRDDVRFLLVGDGAGRERLEKKARSQGLTNVIFTGRIAKQQVPDLLSAVDTCLVHLKKTDLFTRVLPSKIFEAAAMEKPIILGVEGCAAKIVRDAAAGICIEPENAAELVHAVETLAADRLLRQRMGKAGRRYVMKHYNRDVLADDYLSILSAITQPEILEPKHEDHQRRRRAA